MLLGGGAETVIVILANELIECGFEVKILLAGQKNVSSALDPRVVIICDDYIPTGRGSRLVHRFIFLVKQIKSIHTDVFVSFCANINVFVLMANLFSQKRVVVSERADPNAHSFLLQKLIRFLYRFSNAVVTQVPDVSAWFPHSVSEKCIMIPNPIRKDLPEVYQGVRRKKIATSGRMIPEKNLLMLLKAFEILHKDYPDYTLEFFGDGSERQTLQEYVLINNLIDSVIFHDFTENLIKEISDASVFAFSSNSEGMPNSVLEALAMGIPTVSTDCPIGGPRMMITDHENGLLVPVGDVNALYRAMEELLQDTVLAKKLSSRGVLLRDTFSVKKITNQWIELLEKVCS